MKRKPNASYASDHQRQRRIAGWNRIRAEKGLPEPTEAERLERRERNARYFANLKKRQQQEKRAA